MAIVLAYVCLTVFLLHPLFADPANTVVSPARGSGLADVNLILWILAWDWHALTTAPWSLFDANIFHPARSTLAGAEHMLGYLPIFGPVYAASGNLALASQVNLLLAISLSGAGMYALLRHWGIVRSAAFFGGFVYAFCAPRVFQLTAVQLVAGQYLPLAILFLDRTLQTARKRFAVAFAGCLALQMLCSFYLAYMTVISVAAYAAGRLWVLRRNIPVRGVLLALGAAVGAGAVLALVSIPYLEVKQGGVIADYGSRPQLQAFANGLWKNYLYPPVVMREWGYRLGRGASAYLGILPIVCALFCLLPSRGRHSLGWRGARIASLAVMVVSYLMALGPYIDVAGERIPMPYGAAMAVIPGFSSMRVPGRFGLTVMAGFAPLVALGLGRCLAWSRATPTAGLAIVSVLMLGTAYDYELMRPRYEARRLPLGADLPQVYRALGKLPPGPVLEIPVGGDRHTIRGIVAESSYMVASTTHWNPLLNGFSGYFPPSYSVVMALAKTLPDRRGLELLGRATGLRYVVVHEPALSASEGRRWRAPPGLRRLGDFGDDRLFEVASPPPPDLVADLADFSRPGTTLLGNPVVAVPEGDRIADIKLAEPLLPSFTARVAVDVELSITNRSASVWPALAPASPQLVMLAYRWVDLGGRVLREDLSAARLPYDLEPGESVRATFAVIPPRVPPRFRSEDGVRWTLVVGLVQGETWFEGSGALSALVHAQPRK